MLSFKEFLREMSKWNKPDIFYHTTTRNFDPKELHPGSHLGTLQAAMARAKQEWPAHMKKYDRERLRKNDLKVHVYRYKGDVNSLKTVKDKEDDWPTKLSKKPVLYKNKFEDPGSTSMRTGEDHSELEHIHTFHGPKFVERDYAKTLLGWGDKRDQEYLKKKKRL